MSSQLIASIIALVSAFGLGGIAREMYLRYVNKVDLSITNNKELRQAELTHEEKFLSMILGQVDKLTLAERMLIDERIQINKTVANLEAKVHELETRELEHKGEIRDYRVEINRWKEAVEMRDNQITRLQSAIVDLTQELENLRDQIARKGKEHDGTKRS